jgi:propionyl-CoA carboxylase beta chain
MANDAKIKQLQELRKKAELGGGLKRIEKQHASGKMTARERVIALMDPGTFRELDQFRTSNSGSDDTYGEGVVTGWGKVNGRVVYVYSQDFTVVGGSLSLEHADKICKVMDMAMKTGAPIVGIADSGGARIQEGVLSLAGYGNIFLRNTMASGFVPQLTAIMGPCAGGACYSPALTDYIFMVKDTSYMFITGPQVVKTVTFEDVDQETLGGAKIHNSTSGVAHFMSPDEKTCLEQIRKLLSYLPQNNTENPPEIASTDDPNRMDEELNSIVPDDPKKPYDIKKVIRRIVDNGEFLEIQPYYATNLFIALARLNGKTVGIVADQPNALAGVLDIKASVKGARFVRFCDCYNIPIITFEDVPGFLPGVAQEQGGIIRHGAKLLYAYCEATVPKITVICRKAYGGAYVVMNSRNIRGDLVLSWPWGEIAVMGPEGAVNITSKKEIDQSADPEATRKQLIEEYREKFASPYAAAGFGYVDDVIEPKETRPALIKALEVLATKKDTNPAKKHGNIPL